MMRAIWRRCASTGLALMLGLMFGGIVVGAQQSRPPLIVSDIREMDGIALRNGMIDLVATIKTNPSCSVSTQRYLWRWTEVDGKRVQLFRTLDSTSATTLSESGTLILSIPVPKDAIVGDWFYRAVGRDEWMCWLPHFMRPRVWRTPDVPVKIVAP